MTLQLLLQLKAATVAKAGGGFRILIALVDGSFLFGQLRIAQTAAGAGQGVLGLSCGRLQRKLIAQALQLVAGITGGRARANGLFMPFVVPGLGRPLLFARLFFGLLQIRACLLQRERARLKDTELRADLLLGGLPGLQMGTALQHDLPPAS